MLNCQQFKKWCFVAMTYICFNYAAYASPGGVLSLKIVNLSQANLTLEANNPGQVINLKPRGSITLGPSQSVIFDAIGDGAVHCDTCRMEYFNVNYTSSTSSGSLSYNFSQAADNSWWSGNGDWWMRVIDTGKSTSYWFATCASSGWSKLPAGSRCDDAYNFVISSQQVDAQAVAYYRPY